MLLQTADLIVENTSRTKQAKIKVLFDQTFQGTYVTKKTKDIFRLNEITKEKISNNTLGDSKLKGACLDKADLILRNHENKTFVITAPGADAGGCHCCQCSTPKWLTLISKVEVSFRKML